MKKYIIAFALALVACISCNKQDYIYNQWVKVGGYVYPAKPVNLTAVQGYFNITLNWEIPTDPAVRRAMVFWNYYMDSLAVDYTKFKDGNVSVNVPKLEDRSYTFDVVNYDASDNKSLAAELTVSPYGDNWLVTHSERRLISALYQGDSTVITFSAFTDEMAATNVRYKNTSGATVELKEYLKPGENEVVLHDAMPGKYFEFRSSFWPEEGKDTVWNTSWTKSAILYKADAKTWSVAPTTGQVAGSYTADKIFDGISNVAANRWHSSTASTNRKNFPKILAIDTKAEAGKELTFNRLVFHEHLTTASMRYIKNILVYVGDKPYDPNDASYLKDFGDPVCTATLQTNSDYQSVSFSKEATGRYMAIVFKDSYSMNGYIDLWELEPWGYFKADAE